MARRWLWLLLGALSVIVGLALFIVVHGNGSGDSRVVRSAQRKPIDFVSSSPDSVLARQPGSGSEPELAAVLVQTPVIIDPETNKPLIEPLPLQQGELPWEGRIRSVLSREKASD